MPTPFSYALLAEAERSGRPAVLCTLVADHGSVPRHAGSKLLVYGDGQTAGTLGGGELEHRVAQAAQEALAAGAPRRLRHQFNDPPAGAPGLGGEVEVFIEPVRPTPTLLIIGGGHVGQALAHLGHWLGFRVVVNDDRPEFATAAAAPGADQYIAGPVAELAQAFAFHAETYIVLPTRGVAVDVAALPLLLEQPHAYLGVIGSRRRWAATARALLERGVPRAQLERVHAPMGLELNAETPEEIAVSILAEIILLRRGGSGQSMRWTGALEPAAG